jgi:CxxC motif-containing protein
MRFDIDIPGCIFCKTGCFLKVDENTYRSNDYRKKKEINNNNWSKGIQQSFVTVTQYENFESSVLFTFSGKYAKHIPFEFITLSYEELINNLCSLASIYLTQATNPEGLKISRGYVPFYNEYFQKIITNANWFSPNFTKKYYKPKMFRGVLL